MKVKTVEQQNIEGRLGTPVDDACLLWWREEMKAGRQPNTEKLAEYLGVHPQTVRRWYDDYGLRVTARYELEKVK